MDKSGLSSGGHRNETRLLLYIVARRWYLVVGVGRAMSFE